MDYHPTQTIGNSIFFLLLLLTGLLFLYSSSSYSNPFLLVQKESICKSSSSSSSSSNSSSSTIDDLDELASALAKVSTANKTVILAMVNKAYADEDMNESTDTTMLDLFLRSFWVGEGTRHLVDHLLVVAADGTAYERCRFLRLNCFRLETEGVEFEGEKLYMSEDFIKMMWRRTFFLLEVLKRGYNFIFTDTDVMWLRNPFTRLSNNTDDDLQISTDRYLGNPWSERHYINTGFYFVRSNNKTISLFQTWYSKKDNSTGQKEQDVLQNLIAKGIITQLSLKVRFLDTLYFSGFCQDSKNFWAVTTVHANCCRSIAAKVADLRAVLGDWKRFKRVAANSSLDANLTTNVWWSRHFQCRRSWRIRYTKE